MSNKTIKRTIKTNLKQIPHKNQTNLKSDFNFPYIFFTICLNSEHTLKQTIAIKINESLKSIPVGKPLLKLLMFRSNSIKV